MNKTQLLSIRRERLMGLGRYINIKFSRKKLQGMLEARTGKMQHKSKTIFPWDFEQVD